MTALFRKPFLTDRFDLRGGGIDFLGMRQVNLAMLQDELIPGINNTTADLGTFFLGAWIPWKFRQLCRKDDFMLSNYIAFRDAMEVAMAYTTRDGSPAEVTFERSRTRMGTDHVPPLPGPLTFKAAQRTKATSLYAAPLYGPALRYLDLLQSTDAVAADGTSTHIPLAAEDQWTEEIVRHVESSLSASPHFSAVVRLQTPSASGDALDDLGLRGLHPSFYRRAPVAMKRAFLRKYFAANVSGERRRLTAALICQSVTQQQVTKDDKYEPLRRVWLTNLLDSGELLVLDEPSLREHRVRWAIFQARQVQRTLLEVFLRSFELAVGAGCRTVERIIDHWRDRSPAEFAGTFSGTIESLVQAEGRPVYQGTDLLEGSRAWNATVHGIHTSYDDILWSEDDAELVRALRMLARWWLRMLVWIREEVLPVSIEAGQRERLPMRSFHRWVEQRLQAPVTDLLRDLFSDLIFAQHIRVALMRFDGQVQRLRFTLGDEGIVPTPEVGEKLGGHPVRMADRLHSFVSILCDVGILNWADDGRLTTGNLSLPSQGVYDSAETLLNS